jgi:hypothetical protein
LEDAAGKMPALEPKQWLLAHASIYFRVEPDHLPMDYNLAYAQHQVGLSLYRVHDVAILDLVVQGFQQDGINAHDATRSLLLARVNCRGNGRSGIAVTNSAQADLDHCVVGDNGQAQVLLEGHSDTHVSECEIFDNTAPQFVRHGGRLTVDGKPVSE